MPVLQILIILLFMALVPLALGAGASAFVKKKDRDICFMWVAGYMVMFAIFQIIAVPMILKMCTLTSLVWTFGSVCVACALAGGGIWLYKERKTPVLRKVDGMTTKGVSDKYNLLLWGIFGVLLAGQILAAALLAFGDGDDAYYVATSTVAESSDKMYRILPYIGAPTDLDIRHVLAPLPMFVAFLSRVSGVHTAIISHVVMQVFLIPATYAVYGLLGRKLFKGKQYAVALFMIFTSIAIMWGNYSIYTAETFLLTRTRQGKASLSNLVIPFLVYLMYLLGERLAESKKVEKGLWLIVFVTVTTASICSAFGGFLVTLLLGVTGLCVIVTYKRWKLVLPFAISVLPALVYSVMYVILK